MYRVSTEQASSFRFSFRPYLLFPLELNADQRSQQLSIVLHRDVLPHIEAMEVHEGVGFGDRLHARHCGYHLTEQGRSGVDGEGRKECQMKEHRESGMKAYPHLSDMLRKVILSTSCK